MGIHPVDILVWIVLPVFAIRGFVRGLVREIAGLSGLVVGGWSAFRYHPALSSLLKPLINLPQNVSAVVSFVLIFGTVVLLFHLLALFLTTVLKLVLLGGVNRIGGLLFGAMEGIVVLGLVLYLGAYRAQWTWVRTGIASSSAAGSLSSMGNGIVAGWEGRAADAVIKAAGAAMPVKK